MVDVSNGADNTRACVVCGVHFVSGWAMYHHRLEGACREDAICVGTGHVRPVTPEIGGVDGHGTDDMGMDDVDELEGDEAFLVLPVRADGGHVCSNDCDCNMDGEDDDYEEKNMLKYMSWGDCEVTESGKEILRFLCTVMRGKSMSQKKAEDFLR